MSSGDPGERGGAPPRLPGHVIPRPRLVRGIHRLLDQYPVLGVAASAGSGKTTAVIQAAQAHGLLASEAGVPLARALAGTDLVLVLDRVETIGGCAGAEGLLDALVGSLPEGPRLVLISRLELPPGLGGLGDVHRVAFLEDGEPAFDVAEAAEDLRGTDRATVRGDDRGDDPSHLVAATGGWVTGVLYDWWGADADADASAAQHECLSAELLTQLTPAEAALLVRTSLLDDGVTAERASALGRVSPDRTRGPAPCRRWWRSGAVTSPGRGIISAPPKPVPTPPRSGTAGG